jgi:hypothetical protein
MWIIAWHCEKVQNSTSPTKCCINFCATTTNKPIQKVRWFWISSWSYTQIYCRMSRYYLQMEHCYFPNWLKLYQVWK